MSPTSDIDVSKVEGNASPEIKRLVLDGLQYQGTKQFSPSTGKQLRVFETELVSRLHLTEVSVLPKAEEPQKFEARVVYEVIADEYMANSNGHLHGGCTAMLIDNCSSIPIYVLMLATSTIDIRGGGVSQSLNIVYHSPALMGDKLRIVSTTLTVGNRALSSRCEIWNTTRHRLVASAVHIKMVPSEPKASAKL